MILIPKFANINGFRRVRLRQKQGQIPSAARLLTLAKTLYAAGLFNDKHISMEMEEQHRTTYLEPLRGSDFEIADHQSDITGWEVVDTDGNDIGEVEDLIFDSNELKVRYLIVRLSAEISSSSKAVLMPIGVVDLDEDDDEVIVPGVSEAFLKSLPEYEPGKVLSPAAELAIRYAFLGEDALPHAEAVVYDTHPSDFYEHQHFDDARLNRGR